MSDTPRVSVVVPFYQAQDSIEALARSVLGQDFADFELILVDDGSTDGGPAIADALAEEDARVHVIHGPNQGRSIARNTGIEAARGEWLTFADADDHLLDGALSALLKAAEGTDGVWGEYQAQGRKNWDRGYNITLKGHDLLRHIVNPRNYLMDNPPAFIQDSRLRRTVWSTLYKTAIVQEHNIRFLEGLRTGEDALFNIEYLRYTDTVGGCGTPVYFYEMANTGTVRTFDEAAAQGLDSFIDAATSALEPLIGEGLLTRYDLDTFIAYEAWCRLNDAARYSDDVEQSARWLAPVFAREDLKAAMPALVVPPNKSKAMASMRLKLINSGRMAACIRHEQTYIEWKRQRGRMGRVKRRAIGKVKRTIEKPRREREAREAAAAKEAEERRKRLNGKNKYILGYGNRPATPNQVNLDYWKPAGEGRQNLGDWLSVVVYEWMLERRGIKPDQPCSSTKFLAAVGSILDKGLNDSTVWGSGLLWADCPWYVDPQFKALDIRAVRGPDTRALLRARGYECPEVYGDPTVLMPLIYEPEPKERSGAIVVRHLHNQEGADVNIATDDYKSFVDALAAAELVVSSSLHGIILAEVYGTPAVLFDDGRPDFNPLKYDDWYHSTGRASYPVAANAEEAKTMTPPPLPELDALREGLLESFPYDLWD